MNEAIPMAWYETFFDEYYLPNAGSNIPLERTIQEVDFIRKALDLPQKGRISVAWNSLCNELY